MTIRHYSYGTVLRLASAMLVFLTLSTSAGAQTPSPPASQAELLSRAWNAIARGDNQQAGMIANRLRQVEGANRNVAVLALLVEVGIRSGGYVGGLDAYEEWLGGRALEDPYALRPIALTVLRTLSTSDRARAIAEAREALAADGDARAIAERRNAIESGDAVAVTLAATEGHAGAIDRLLAEVKSGAPGAATIEALGEGGTQRVTPALLPLLDQ